MCSKKIQNVFPHCTGVLSVPSYGITCWCGHNMVYIWEAKANNAEGCGHLNILHLCGGSGTAGSEQMEPQEGGGHFE